MRTRFATKPGKSFTSTGVFPSALRSSTTRCVVSSDVASPRMTSTSCITGTGFMKCIPITCSGRFVLRRDLGDRDRARVRRENRARPAAMRSRSAKIRNLRSRIFGRGFDDERCAVPTAASRARRDPAEARLAGRRRQRALLDLPVDVLLDRLPSAPQRVLRDVDHVTGNPAARTRARSRSPSALPRYRDAVRHAMTPRGACAARRGRSIPRICRAPPAAAFRTPFAAGGPIGPSVDDAIVRRRERDAADGM